MENVWRVDRSYLNKCGFDSYGAVQTWAVRVHKRILTTVYSGAILKCYLSWHASGQLTYLKSECGFIPPAH